MPASSKADALAQQARFVFKGTVQKLRASTVPDIKDKSGTVIVRVDEIIHAPEELSYFSGHDITVQLSGRKKVKVGEQNVFHTNSWLFGDSIAVVSLRQEAVGKVSAALDMAMTTGDPVKNLLARDMKERFESADLVVSGRVTSVRLPTDTVSAVDSASEPLTPSSEHDPMWHEAVIDVASVHKGDGDQKTVTLRFPSSEDVMWHRAPKFKPGQDGIFMLQKSKIKEHASAADSAGAIETVEAYTAFSPVDFQPHSHPEEADTLVNLITSLG